MGLFRKKSLEFEQVTTKGGDKGQSFLYSGEQAYKDDIRFRLMGDIDELTSWLGLAYQETQSWYLQTIQDELYNAMSIIATNPNNELYSSLKPIEDKHIEIMETKQKALMDKVEIEPKFLLPGSTNEAEARLDLSRAVARRCERSIVDFIRNTSAATYSNAQDIYTIQRYLNRLSDYLFVAARAAAKGA